jgi:hypothetical protein
MRQTAFQNQIKATSIDSITPAQILQAGKPIFLGIADKADLQAINTVIDAYQGIHAPIYGNTIPLTGLVSSVAGSEVILQPSSNEVRKVIAISVTNSGAAPVVGSLTVGGVQFADFAADPGSTATISISELYSTKVLMIAAVISAGTPSDLTTNLASVLTVQ